MNNQIKIADLREVPEWLETISRWHHNEWHYLNPDRTLEMRLEFMQEHLLDKPVPSTFVALMNDEVIGSAAIKVTDMPERPELTPWLASVYVKPSARHLGAGRMVVQRIMDHAKSSGVKEMYLYTPDKEHFYRHMGWETMEKTVYHGTNVTIMKLIF